MSISHYDDAITELAMKSLVVQLLEDLFKVSRKIHDPMGKESVKTLKSLRQSQSTQGVIKERGVEGQAWIFKSL